MNKVVKASLKIWVPVVAQAMLLNTAGAQDSVVKYAAEVGSKGGVALIYDEREQTPTMYLVLHRNTGPGNISTNLRIPDYTIMTLNLPDNQTISLAPGRQVNILIIAPADVIASWNYAPSATPTVGWANSGYQVFAQVSGTPSVKTTASTSNPTTITTTAAKSLFDRDNFRTLARVDSIQNAKFQPKPSADLEYRTNANLAPQLPASVLETVTPLEVPPSKTIEVAVVKAGVSPNPTGPTATAPSSSNNTQTIMVNATGGTFSINFGGDTANVQYDASAADLQTALEGLSAIGKGNVQVSKTGQVFTITFIGQLAAKQQQLIEVIPDDLTGATHTATAARVKAPTISNSQTITVDANAGTYDINFGGEVATLKFDASATDMQTALEGLTTIGKGNATVTQSGKGYTITFTGKLAAKTQQLIEVDADSLAGTAVAAKVKTVAPPAASNKTPDSDTNLAFTSTDPRISDAQQYAITIDHAGLYNLGNAFSAEMVFSRHNPPSLGIATTEYSFNNNLHVDAIAIFPNLLTSSSSGSGTTGTKTSAGSSTSSGQSVTIGEALTYSSYIGSPYEEDGKKFFGFPLRFSLSLGFSALNFGTHALGGGQPFVAFGIQIPIGGSNSTSSSTSTSKTK